MQGAQKGPCKAGGRRHSRAFFPQAPERTLSSSPGGRASRIRGQSSAMANPSPAQRPSSPRGGRFSLHCPESKQATGKRPSVFAVNSSKGSPGVLAANPPPVG